MTDENHIGDRNDMVVGDNDHGDAIPRCGSCGVAWVDHIGIMGVCAENTKLREERDEARREICEYQPRYYGKNSVTIEAENAAERRGWDCYDEKKKEETQ